jgi:pyruvate dehydrogenase E2 component (dihydrolipoamide acetyltransferase)
MATEIKLPSLGEGVESGDVLEILVQEGETVKQGSGLMELETDKATVTVPSPSSGKIVSINVKQGDTVAVGSVIATLEGAGGGAAAKPAAPKTEAPAAKPAPAAKAAAPKPAPAAAEQPAAAEAPPAAPKPAPAKPAPAPAPQPEPAPLVQREVVPVAPQAHADAESAPGEVIPAGPAIRRFAREVGIELSQVVGTGEGGRITREDVLLAVRESGAHRAAANQLASAPATQATVTTPTSTVPAPAAGHKVMTLPGSQAQDEYGPVRVERLSKIRKTIAAQMHKSWSTVPRVTNFDDADVTDLEIFRASSKDDYAAQGIKLTTMPFLIKAVATALRHQPAINAVLDMDNEQIVYKDYVNVGIAVDTERGLVVPNIRNADQLSIPEIAKALADLAARVRGGEFGVNELRGGTFTISNLGAIGGTYSTPIVNVPEVAILLVGRTRKLPVVMEDDSIKPRLMMPLSLSYDHRLVDGGTAARFLNDVIAYLEAPSRLLLAIN